MNGEILMISFNGNIFRVKIPLPSLYLFFPPFSFLLLSTYKSYHPQTVNVGIIEAETHARMRPMYLPKIGRNWSLSSSPIWKSWISKMVPGCKLILKNIQFTSFFFSEMSKGKVVKEGAPIASSQILAKWEEISFFSSKCDCNNPKLYYEPKISIFFVTYSHCLLLPLWVNWSGTETRPI